MENFRTRINVAEPGFTIGHDNKVFIGGSCFAENMGMKLRDLNFNTLLNPFGILYHPLILARMMERLFDNAYIQQKELFESGGLWHSFDHHGRFSAARPEKALTQMNEAFEQARIHLDQADRLFFTFGTANAFLFLESNRMVANCHKMPGHRFARVRTSVEEIVQAWQSILLRVFEKKPEAKVVFTVSPVRHLRDGLVENQRSKAVLVLAAEQLTSLFPDSFYFPAYEMLLDDLRDYRFYEADMAHPSAQAIDYIWQHFAQTFFDRDTRTLNAHLHALRADLNHQPLHPDQPAYRQFLENLLEKMSSLESRHPFLNFSDEKNRVLHSLKNLKTIS